MTAEDFTTGSKVKWKGPTRPMFGLVHNEAYEVGPYTPLPRPGFVKLVGISGGWRPEDLELIERPER